MHRRHHIGSQRRFNEFAALLGHAEVLAQEGLCGGGPQANQHLGLHRGDFRLQPGTASADFAGIGFRVLSSSFPAGPTNGLPAMSSESPGCSPTNITRAFFGPPPNTVWFRAREARRRCSPLRPRAGSGGWGCPAAVQRRNLAAWALAHTKVGMFFVDGFQK
jgi:hypothetical protein